MIGDAAGDGATEVVVGAVAERITASDDISGFAVTPEPTEEELAAILCAHAALWPEPSAPAQAPDPSPRWRWAGRWWTPRIRYGGWA